MTISAQIETIFQNISEHVADPEVTGWVAEEVMTPLAGVGAPVAPPTYAHPEGGDDADKKKPLHAVSQTAFIPARTEGSTWHDSLLRAENGRPVLAPSVILDSVGSRVGRVEAAIWDRREELGGLPAYIVKGRPVTQDEVKGVHGRLLTEAKETIEGLDASSWTLPHRHADAWIRLANDPKTGKHVRDGGGDLDGLARMNTTADATDLFCTSPNSILFGFWYSQDSGQRNKQPRIYSGETVGYGAHAVTTSSARIDQIPMPKDHEIELTDKAGAKKKSIKPSDLGLGMIPNGAPVTRAYACELILNRATISLTALRNVRYGQDHAKKSHAASVLLAIMGMIGHVMTARDETMLRSGCDLLVAESTYGWRRTRSTEVEAFDLPTDPEVLTGLFRRARQEAEKVGLVFGTPIELEISETQAKGIGSGFTIDKAAKAGE